MRVPAAQRPRQVRFPFLRSFSALILREMTTTYGRSPGGYIWAIAEPVAASAVLSLVFSMIIRNPDLGNNFMYFFIGGTLIMGLYSTTAGVVASSVRFSRALLEYPTVSFIDAVLARFTLNLMTQLLVMVIVITGVIVGYGLTPVLRWPSIFMAIAMAASFGVGVGLLNCYLITNYPLWERIWAVVNRPLFIISGVMYTPEQLPPHVRDILMWNPLMHATSEMRRGMFITYDAVHVRPVYVFSISLVLAIFGLMLLRRHYRDLLLK